MADYEIAQMVHVTIGDDKFLGRYMGLYSEYNPKWFQMGGGPSGGMARVLIISPADYEKIVAPNRPRYDLIWTLMNHNLVVSHNRLSAISPIEELLLFTDDDCEL